MKASPSLKNGIRFKRHVRHEERRPLIGNVLFPPPSSGQEERSLSGLTADLSRAGMGLHTDDELPVGDIITVSSSMLGEEPRRARVVWCRQESAGVYRAGLSFA